MALREVATKAQSQWGGLGPWPRAAERWRPPNRRILPDLFCGRE